MTTTVKPTRSTSTKLRIVSTSDNHLYHPRVPVIHTIETMDWIISEDEHADGIDILFIAGDLFDRTVPFGDESVTPILAWMSRLLSFVSRHDIVLRILYGTPRHDRKQSARFNDLILQMGFDIDFRYVNTLEIEYIGRFGINVLYVPDEWRTESSTTLDEVRTLMASRHLSKVDFAVMHGFFDYQVPNIGSAQIKAHDSDTYLDLVSNMIFIGHHHVFSQKERIVAHGSSTRLAHSEEGPKGYVVYDLFDDDQWNLTFVENKDAWTFKRLKVESCTYEDVIALIESGNYRNGSYINLEATSDSEVSRTFKNIRRRFPLLNIDLVRPKVFQQEEELKSELDDDYVAQQLSENNVTDAVLTWLSSKQVPVGLLENCREALEDAKLHITE